MAKIVYGQRYESLQSYDTDCITFLENLGSTVVNLQSSEVPTYDFTGTDLFIVGAPGTDNLAYPEATFLQTLELDILSMCRYTSRYTFGMSLGSGVSTVDSFTVVDTAHEIIFGFSGTILIGTSQTCHRLHNLTAETNLILHNGLAGYAGVAERFATINTETYKRVHWGYHEIGSLTQDGITLFENTFYYLLVGTSSEGSYVSLPKDLSSFGISAPALKIKWIVEDLSGDSTFTVETAITGKSVGIPIEPIEADWSLQTNDSLIVGLPLDLTDQFLWVRIFMSRLSPSVPSPKLGWLVVYNSSDSPLAAVRLDFLGMLSTIDETGSKLFTEVLQMTVPAYNVYTLPLDTVFEYDYLTTGNISIGTEYSEQIITIGAGDIIYEDMEEFPPEYLSNNVLEGTSLEEIISSLPDTITIYGTYGEEAEASIVWDIPGYDLNTPGTYNGYGTVILPEGWTGEPIVIDISVTVSSPSSPPPPTTGTYDIWTKKNGKWVYATSIGVKKESKWVGV